MCTLFFGGRTLVHIYAFASLVITTWNMLPNPTLEVGVLGVYPLFLAYSFRFPFPPASP